MPRLHLASSLFLGSLLAANTPCPVFSQENASPGGAPNTLPPVKVAPLPANPTKTPRVVARKKLAKPVAQTDNRSQSSPPQPPEPGDPESGTASGSVALPGREELSPAASAQPAASVTLNAKQIERTPVNSYGDIFRPLPGIDVSYYGQGAVGYGISMRGFTDAEHGRDIAYFIDGVPVNEISAIHTPNYADLNILIPETVKTLEIIRGPFAIEAGNSNVGGSVFLTTKSLDPYAGANVSGGSWGTGRGLATYGSDTGSYVPYLVLEGYHTDGYRDNSFIDRYNSFDKVTIAAGGGDTLTIRVQAYGTTSGAPGYLESRCSTGRDRVAHRCRQSDRRLRQDPAEHRRAICERPGRPAIERLVLRGAHLIDAVRRFLLRHARRPCPALSESARRRA